MKNRNDREKSAETSKVEKGLWMTWALGEQYQKMHQDTSPVITCDPDLRYAIVNMKDARWEEL